MRTGCEGHRGRLRERYMRAGLRGFDDREIIELLLGYAVPRRDQRETSFRLMEAFGSLHGVISQPVAMLEKVEGVGGASAVLLSLVSQVTARALGPERGAVVLDSAASVREYLRQRLGTQRRERLVALLLDSGGRLLAEKDLELGTVDRASVHPRNLVEQVIAHNATSVILVHNHPGGRLEASREDRALTARLEDLGRSLGFRILDHFIVTDGGVLSLRELDSGAAGRP